MELKLVLFSCLFVGVFSANLLTLSFSNMSSFKASASVSVAGYVESSYFFFNRRVKYLKRRIKYSSGHPGSFNPTVITNKEAHMVNGNMDSEAGTSQASSVGKKKTKKISDYFFKNEQVFTSGTGKFFLLKLVLQVSFDKY